MFNAELKICENCRFFFHQKPYVEVDLFGKERRRIGVRYCKWIGKRIKKKAPACGIFKEKK